MSEVVTEWDQAIGCNDKDRDRAYYDLERFVEEFVDEYESEEIPEFVDCLAYETPKLNALQCLDDIIENQIDQNFCNAEGECWSDYIDRRSVEEIAAKIQPLLDDLVTRSTFKKFVKTGKQIAVKELLTSALSEAGAFDE